MPIALPNLDDRRWTDLVEQGRSLIPLYAPEWTDHNATDPGITLMELFAWVAEMDLYRLNRIPERHKRRLLALMGLRPEGPSPARAVVTVQYTGKHDPPALPDAVQFLGSNLAGDPVFYQAQSSLEIVLGQLTAVLSHDGSGYQNQSARLARQEAFPALGANPAPGAALYLGFDHAIPKDQWASLYFRFSGDKAGWEERQRLLAERGTPALPAHHSVRITWEYRGPGGVWLPLETEDGTRSLTLNGVVRVKPGQNMAAAMLGSVPRSLFYLRARFASGGYDAPPVIERILWNAVEVTQAIPVSQSIAIAKGTVVADSFAPGDSAALQIELQDGAVTSLSRDANPDAPQFTVLHYVAATAYVAGFLTLEAALAGRGSGEPNQVVTLAVHPVIEESLQLFSLEGSAWRRWERRDDLAASKRTDAHFLLNSTSGELTFGDGERGRVVPEGALLFAVYQSTAAERGVLGAGQITRIASTPHNQALGVDGASLNDDLLITNPLAPEGGEPAETTSHAIGRAIELREAALRAVTAGDFETLARETPGTHVARAIARPNAYPGFDCIQAAGIVSVVIVPAMLGPRPQPSAGLLREVAARLEKRRIIGTRIKVTGPQYLSVVVRARVKAFPTANTARLKDSVTAAIHAFLDPLGGGPDHTGWPLGRDIYRSEILQIIDETLGVDHVLSLELIPEGCQPQCGNLCLRPGWLPASGAHEIEVS